LRGKLSGLVASDVVSLEERMRASDLAQAWWNEREREGGLGGGDAADMLRMVNGGRGGG